MALAQKEYSPLILPVKATTISELFGFMDLTINRGHAAGKMYICGRKNVYKTLPEMLNGLPQLS